MGVSRCRFILFSRNLLLKKDIKILYFEEGKMMQNSLIIDHLRARSEGKSKMVRFLKEGQSTPKSVAKCGIEIP